MESTSEKTLLALIADYKPMGANAKILAINLENGEPSVFLDINGETPDGIAIDAANEYVYWTNMGKLTSGENAFDNDGTISRVNFDGSDKRVIIPVGSTTTPKQMTLDLVNKHIYWSDREGMRVMRSNLDGSNIETIVQTGSTEEERQNANNHCVGIAVDPASGYFYWTQKGAPKGGTGRIFRAKINTPTGKSATDRDDIELLFENLPEPIDLEIDHGHEYLYWTDRGKEVLGGNTLNRAKLDTIGRVKPEIVASGHKEIIGLAISHNQKTAFTADLGGNIRRFDLLTGIETIIYHKPHLITGIAFI